MRAGFGVPAVDEVLGGGLERGKIALLSTDERQGRKLAYAFLLDGLARREGGLLVAADQPAAEVRTWLERLDEHVAEYEHEGALRYVCAADCEGEARRDAVERVASAWDLNALVAAVDRARQTLGDRPQTRVVVETATELLDRGSTERGLRFLEVLLERVRGPGTTALLVVDADAHAAGVLDELSAMTDGRIELRGEDGLRLRATGLGRSGESGWRGSSLAGFEHGFDPGRQEA